MILLAAGLPTLPERHIFNVNIPDVAELKGTKVTFQGRRQPVQADYQSCRSTWSPGLLDWAIG